MQINLSPTVTETYPGACCGFLAVSGGANPAFAPALEARKLELQAQLRASYPDEAAIKADPALQAYAAYYRRFKKTYHVALQLESVALKGRSIPSVSALVECMFAAELQDRLLTAGHDRDALQGGVRVDVGQGSESYTTLRGSPQALKPGDLYMADAGGIISSIIYGPDQRTQITPATTRALFTVYAPPGIAPESVLAHLDTIETLVMLVSPSGVTEMKAVLP